MGVDAYAVVKDGRPAPAIPVEVLAPDPVLQQGIEAALRHCREITTDCSSEPAVTVMVVDTIGDEVLHQLRAAGQRQQLGILLVATSMDATAILRAIEAGAGGILRRSESSTEGLSAAVLAVAKGHGTLPPDLLGDVMDRLRQLELPDSARYPSAVLDEREKTVLRMIADGRGTAEIARALAYSARTVSGIVHDITRRLRLRNRAHAVAFALRNGLI